MRTKIDVRRAIIERGYKIPAFAKKCGMTPVNLRSNIINGNPTVKKLSEKIGITSRAVEKQLASLVEKGFIKREGSPKGGHWEILKLLAVGMYNKEVGKRLEISERTVKNHVSNIFKKLVTD